MAKDILSEDPIILECGMRGGKDIVRFKKQLPNSIIHTLEVHPVSFQNYKRVAETLKDVYVNNFALSNKNGSIIFYKSKVNPGASSIFSDNLITLLSEQISGYKDKAGFVELNVEQLNFFVINKIDFI